MVLRPVTVLRTTPEASVNCISHPTTDLILSVSIWNAISSFTWSLLGEKKRVSAERVMVGSFLAQREADAARKAMDAMIIFLFIYFYRLDLRPLGALGSASNLS